MMPKVPGPETGNLRYRSGNPVNIPNMRAGTGWSIFTKLKALNGSTRFNGGQFESVDVLWMNPGRSAFFSTWEVVIPRAPVKAGNQSSSRRGALRMTGHLDEGK
jgi:hypothetical protein